MLARFLLHNAETWYNLVSNKAMGTPTPTNFLVNRETTVLPHVLLIPNLLPPVLLLVMHLLMNLPLTMLAALLPLTNRHQQLLFILTNQSYLTWPLDSTILLFHKA